MNEAWVTRTELDGFGKRVNVMEAFAVGQEKVNDAFRRDIDNAGDDIKDIFTLLNEQSKQTYKIIGGVGVVVVVLNLLAVAAVIHFGG